MKSIHLALVASLSAGCTVGDDDDSLEISADLAAFHGRFGSPTIVNDNGVLHGYFPIQQADGHRINVAHARSNDDGQTWLYVGDAVPSLSKEADPTGAVWAPGAAKIADGEWMLFYTAVDKGTAQHMCTYRAHADGPHGPFIDDFDGPIVCTDGGLWAIDPYPIQDAQGDWNLLARIDHPGGDNTISIRKLTANGRQFADGSAWTELTHITGGWENPVMENAAIVRLDDNGTKHWYVFYSGGSYKDDSYGIGYADCGTSINGPCSKKTAAAAWLGTDESARIFGPGTPTFYIDNQGRQIMAANVWKYKGGESNSNNAGQIMALFEVHIDANHKPVSTFLHFAQ